MIDHIGFTLLMEFSDAAAGFGREGDGDPVRGRLHSAFEAETRAAVDAFHAAAIEAVCHRPA